VPATYTSILFALIYIGGILQPAKRLPVQFPCLSFYKYIFLVIVKATYGNIVTRIKGKIIIKNLQKQKILCTSFYNYFKNIILTRSPVLSKKHWMKLLPMESLAQQQQYKKLETEFREGNVMDDYTLYLYCYQHRINCKLQRLM